ncbi:MAG: fumarylacetoacetate hydrolase family protein [Desulfobacterales bacterium]|nr:fumarylacetoacetate hydrolase family protein [Desulfobacterales bacterium]
MKIIRFLDKEGNIHSGCDVQDSSASIVKTNSSGQFIDTKKRVKIKSIKPPIAPAAIFCIGLNYRLHAEETGLEIPNYPVVFMKNPASVTSDGSEIFIPESCINPPQVDYEAELAVVIGKAAKNVKKEQALDYVAGYTCANDISAREWQKNAGAKQWIKGKSFDTFCPIGPFLVTKDEIIDPHALEIQCRLNGQLLQKSSTSDMIFTINEIIEYLSESATLLPGTLILTGTPSGVGFTRKPPKYLTPGDILETEIESIGTLTNFVKKATYER